MNIITGYWYSQSPFILRVDTAFYSLIDEPLGVPDRGEVGDGVQAVTVSVPGIGHVDHVGVETVRAGLHDGSPLLPRHPQPAPHSAGLPPRLGTDHRGQGPGPRLEGEE